MSLWSNAHKWCKVIDECNQPTPMTSAKHACTKRQGGSACHGVVLLQLLLCRLIHRANQRSGATPLCMRECRKAQKEALLLHKVQTTSNHGYPASMSNMGTFRAVRSQKQHKEHVSDAHATIRRNIINTLNKQVPSTPASTNVREAADVWNLSLGQLYSSKPQTHADHLIRHHNHITCPNENNTHPLNASIMSR